MTIINNRMDNLRFSFPLLYKGLYLISGNPSDLPNTYCWGGEGVDATDGPCYSLTCNG